MRMNLRTKTIYHTQCNSDEFYEQAVCIFENAGYIYHKVEISLDSGGSRIPLSITFLVEDEK